MSPSGEGLRDYGFLFFVAYRTMLIYKYVTKNSRGVIHLISGEHR
jgi:hypothetical protein